MGSDYRFLTVWRVAGTVREVMAVWVTPSRFPGGGRRCT